MIYANRGCYISGEFRYFDAGQQAHEVDAAIAALYRRTFRYCSGFVMQVGRVKSRRGLCVPR